MSWTVIQLLSPEEIGKIIAKDLEDIDGMDFDDIEECEFCGESPCNCDEEDCEG